jgi:hypothetical protein
MSKASTILIENLQRINNYNFCPSLHHYTQFCMGIFVFGYKIRYILIWGAVGWYYFLLIETLGKPLLRKENMRDCFLVHLCLYIPINFKMSLVWVLGVNSVANIGHCTKDTGDILEPVSGAGRISFCFLLQKQCMLGTKCPLVLSEAEITLTV